jgi:hypothetical protein
MCGCGVINYFYAEWKPVYRVVEANINYISWEGSEVLIVAHHCW